MIHDFTIDLLIKGIKNFQNDSKFLSSVSGNRKDKMGNLGNRLVKLNGNTWKMVGN